MPAAFSVALRNARADAITAAIGAAAKLIIYAGARPATGGAPGAVLYTGTLGTPFAPAAAAGALAGNLPAATPATATGTAAWARITTSADVFVADLSCGTSNAELILNSLSLTQNVNVSITAINITEGNA